jgi:hypothetical protein
MTTHYIPCIFSASLKKSNISQLPDIDRAILAAWFEQQSCDDKTFEIEDTSRTY